MMGIREIMKALQDGRESFDKSLTPRNVVLLVCFYITYNFQRQKTKKYISLKLLRFKTIL